MFDRMKSKMAACSFDKNFSAVFQRFLFGLPKDERYENLRILGDRLARASTASEVLHCSSTGLKLIGQVLQAERDDVENGVRLKGNFSVGDERYSTNDHLVVQCQLVRFAYEFQKHVERGLESSQV